MAASDASRHLLFGILAWQMHFLRRDELVAAVRAWSQEPSRPIEAILLEQGALSDSDCRFVGRLVARYVDNHDGDVETSVAAACAIAPVCLVESLHEAIEYRGDRQIKATLARVARRRKGEQKGQAVDGTTGRGTTGVPRGTRAPGAPAAGSSRFRIIRPHAKGGLGEVFVAEDLELGREVALKEIQSRHADDPDSRGRFVLEAEVTGGLEHPGVVPVYGLGRYPDGRPYYAMRFIRGESLKEAADRFHRKVDDTGQSDHPHLSDAVGNEGEPKSPPVAETDPGSRPRAEVGRGRSAGDPHRVGARRPMDSMEFRKLLGRFVDVCNAIAYAHSRGVLHRDLKPGNIMLGKFGETLVVDWGLAKIQGRDDRAILAGQAASRPKQAALRPKSGSGGAATPMGSVIGTPAYMAPEQAAGKLDQLGPASDVYSLGATLYHLLTGRAPIRGRNLRVTLDKVRRGDFPAPRKLKPEIPRALEAICLRAMASTPHDRYGSPQELADDVERFLADEPVTAFREPLTVRVRRWMRKHPTLVAAVAATILVGLFGSGLIAAIVSRHANVLAEKNEALTVANARLDQANARLEEKNRALERSTAAERQAKQDALAVIGFFENHVLARARPKGQQGGLGIDATIRAAIDAAEPTIAKSFADHPLVEAAIRNSLGLTYTYLGEAGRAIRQHERALELRRSRLGADHRETLMSMNNLALAYRSAGRFREALPLYEEAVKRLKSKWGPDNPDTLTTMNNLASAYYAAGRVDEALRLFEETRKRRKAKLGADHPDTLATMGSLALAYKSAGRLREALTLYEETLQRKKAKLGPDHPDTLATMGNLAAAYGAVGRSSEAIRLLETTIERERLKFGPDHPRTLSSMNTLASCYEAAGRLREALPLYETTLARRKAKLGPDHPDTLTSMNNLASAYHAAGRLEQALGLYEETLARMKSTIGPDHPETLRAMHNLAAAYKSAGRLGEALPLYEETLKRRKSKLGPDHPDTLTTMGNLATAYEAAGRLREAFRLHEKTLKLRRAKLGPDHPHTLASMNNLAGAYLATSRVDAAVPLFEEALRRMKPKLGPNHPYTLTLTNNLAAAYLEAGRGQEALPLISRFIEGARKRLKPDNPRLAALLADVATRLVEHGQPAAAEPYIRECLAIREKAMPGHWLVSSTQSLLGGALAGQKKYEEAEGWLIRGYEGLARHADSIPAAGKPRITEALQRLIDLYTAWGKPKEAARWKAKLAKGHAQQASD